MVLHPNGARVAGGWCGMLRGGTRAKKLAFRGCEWLGMIMIWSQ